MNVYEVIVALSKMPLSANVFHLGDGECRTEINLVWLGKDGDVVTSDFDMVLYSEECRPIGAPSEKEDPYWCSPQNAQQSVQLTAFGARLRARLGNYIIRLGCRLARVGGN
uniref:Uncharacterized protein n=1 Tax=viral metagenome TaxID=1070528 RepID=A0A6M3LNX1_9ZZZZ